MTFVGHIDLVQYTLGLSGNFNPRLVSPKYLRYIFVSLCGVNSFIFSFSFWLREVRIDLVRTSTILLHVRFVISRKFRYRAPKTGAFTTRALLSQNYNARENSLQLPNPDTRNPPSNPEPKWPLVQIGGGYFCNTPYILDKRIRKSCFTHSHRLLFAIQNPRPP